MTLVAITPIGDEFEALSEALTSLGLQGELCQIGRIEGLSFDGGRIVVARGGLGKAQFGVQTQHILENLDGVKLAVCAGTAGGLLDSISIGDVIVATVTVEHDFNCAFSKKPLPRFEGHPDYLSAIERLLPSINTPFDIHFGPVASGDEDIVGAERGKNVHDLTGALAVAWEGAGGARAAAFSGVPFLEIRGISDGAGENATNEFFENIPLAVSNVALVLDELAKNLPS